MCFAPQLRGQWCAFTILTSKYASRRSRMHIFKSSPAKSAPNPELFWTSWLPKVLRARGVLHFSSLIRPDGSAPAALASLLFEPPDGATKHWKNNVSRLFLPFRACYCSFFRLFLFSDLLSLSFLFLWLFPPLLLHLSIVSEVWLQNFLRSYHICMYIYTHISYHIISYHIISYHIIYIHPTCPVPLRPYILYEPIFLVISQSKNISHNTNSIYI